MATIVGITVNAIDLSNHPRSLAGWLFCTTRYNSYKIVALLWFGPHHLTNATDDQPVY
jgi:hypothetical protein